MKIYAGLIALLEWLALSLQCYLTLTLSVANGKSQLEGVLNFFSYFTILSNLAVAVVVTFLCFRGRGAFFARPLVQSGVAVYILIVGVVYSLLLREIWDPRGPQKLADVLLHDALPVLYLLFWFVFAEKKGLRWTDALRWLVFPILYCSYALLRGATTGWYPYPFIDASKLGYPIVVRNSVVLLFVFLAVGGLVIAIARGLSRLRTSSAVQA